MVWWRVKALVEAPSASDAMKVLRREGAVIGGQIVYEDGAVVLEGIAPADTPWKPAHTAPRDGRSFIAFDDVAKHGETARWSNEDKRFVNDVGDQNVLFTRWMEHPA